MLIRNLQKRQLKQLERSKIRSREELTKPRTEWYLRPLRETPSLSSYLQNTVCHCPTCGQILSNAASQMQNCQNQYANSSPYGLWQAQAQSASLSDLFGGSVLTGIFGV